MAQAAATLKLHFNTFKKYAKQYGVYSTNIGLKGGRRHKPSSYDLKEILDGKHPEYPTKRVKSRLFKEGIKQRICERCNNSKWLDTIIPLELNHIDGNKYNHKLENLEVLCPNCHAMTETYRGRNKSKYKNK